jgi:ribosomal protein L2
MATLGQVGNIEHFNVSIGKARKSDGLAKGLMSEVTMNPVATIRMEAVRVRLPVEGIRVLHGVKPTKGYKTRRNKRQAS